MYQGSDPEGGGSTRNPTSPPPTGGPPPLFAAEGAVDCSLIVERLEDGPLGYAFGSRPGGHLFPPGRVWVFFPSIFDLNLTLTKSLCINSGFNFMPHQNLGPGNARTRWTKKRQTGLLLRVAIIATANDWYSSHKLLLFP